MCSNVGTMFSPDQSNYCIHVDILYFSTCNYFVFIFHFSQHVTAKPSSTLLLLLLLLSLLETKRLKITVKMQIYTPIFARIYEVLQTGLLPPIYFSRRKFDMSFIVQSFKTEVLPTVPQNSLSQVCTSTTCSEVNCRRNKQTKQPTHSPAKNSS